MAHARANTLEAFALGLRLGATGIETDAWRTADGVVVLDHDGVVRSGVRRRAVADLTRDELPPHIPTLADLYDTCGVDVPVSIDVKLPDVAPAIVEVARSCGAALDRLYLCNPASE